MENAKTCDSSSTRVKFQNGDNEMEEQELTICGEWGSPLERENVVIIWAIISDKIKDD